MYQIRDRIWVRQKHVHINRRTCTHFTFSLNTERSVRKRGLSYYSPPPQHTHTQRGTPRPIPTCVVDTPATWSKVKTFWSGLELNTTVLEEETSRSCVVSRSEERLGSDGRTRMKTLIESSLKRERGTKGNLFNRAHHNFYLSTPNGHTVNGSAGHGTVAVT